MHHLTILVPAADLDHANAALSAYGEAVISVPLSTDGTEPPTHYGCNWLVSPAERVAINTALSGSSATLHPGTGKQIPFADAIASAGLQTIPDEEEDL